MIVLIMGVSGCGKTTLGEECARAWAVNYFEADSYHPAANIEKMSSGIPLDDHDRWPWLGLIREEIQACQSSGLSAVFSCSALKESYRRFLEEGLDEPLLWVYLRGSYDVLYKRLQSRRGHYQKADMLKSQFEALEEPAYGLVLDIELSLKEKLHILSGAFKEKGTAPD